MRLGSGVSWPRVFAFVIEAGHDGISGTEVQKDGGPRLSRAVAAFPFQPSPSSCGRSMECETRAEFNRGVNQFSQLRFVQRGQGSQGWGRLCRRLRLEALGQVLLQLGDLVGLGIVFSLGPLASSARSGCGRRNRRRPAPSDIGLGADSCRKPRRDRVDAVPVHLSPSQPPAGKMIRC